MGKNGGVKALKVLEEKLMRKDPSYWTEYRIAKTLGMSQTSYVYARDSGHSLRRDRLIRAQELAEREVGISLDAFWKILKDESVALDTRKSGRLTKV